MASVFIQLLTTITGIYAAAAESKLSECEKDKNTVLNGQYCSQCATPGEVPINGICIPLSDPRAIASGCQGEDLKALPSSSKSCKTCEADGYFFHDGGCYNVLYSPGNLICEAAESGKCTKCRGGFFLDKTTSPDQCKPCHADCFTCSGSKNNDCLSCVPSKFLKADAKECKDCSDKTNGGEDNCEECTKTAETFSCTLCKTGYFLSSGKCLNCAANCAVCTGTSDAECTFCVEKYSYSDKEKKCTKTCDESNTDANKCKTGKCTALGGKYCSQCALTTDSLIEGVCVTNNKDLCIPFDVANGTCSSCAKGYVLFEGGCYKIDSELGKRVCGESFDIQQKTYCRKCAQSGFVPIAGVCIKFDDPSVKTAGCMTARGTPVTSSDVSCVSCGKNGFLHNGGCYSNKTSPGNVICDEIDGVGGCKVCQSRYYRRGSSCLPCHESCKTCKDNAQNSCLSCEKDVFVEVFVTGKGYCRLCNDTSLGQVFFGVKNCMVCAPKPLGINVICEACEKGFILKDNKCVQVCVEAASGSGKCKDSCCNVLSNKFCSECAASGECPIDGICTKKPSGIRVSAGTCSNCPNGYFPYSGGCYKKGTAPGILICKDADSATNTCKTCADGYVTSGDSCKACETPNCKVCDSMAKTCTECVPGYYLRKDTGKDTTCEKGCVEGFGSGMCIYGGCTVRQNTFCSRCSEGNEIPVDAKCMKVTKNKPECLDVNAGTCTRCNPDYLLYYGGCYKRNDPILDLCENSNQIEGRVFTYCKQCKNTAEYPISGSCTADKDGNTCADGKCTSCGPGYFMHNSVCMKANVLPEVCARAGSGVCEECGKDYFRNPAASTTIQSCIACNDTTGASGYTGISNCNTCTPPDSTNTAVCTDCIDRYILTDQGQCEETCPEAPKNKSETGKCAHGHCNLLNKKYCSKCSSNSDYLIDGKCVDTVRYRASADICMRHNPQNGTCASCAKTHLFYMGGCYNPENNPGNDVCKFYYAVDNTLYCFWCGDPADLAVDGHCLVPGEPGSSSCIPNRVPSGFCYYCDDSHFLLLGSCVTPNKPPGNAVCKSTSTNTGMCEICKEGYYAPPGRSIIEDSCIPCTYSYKELKGITHCATCEVSQNRLVCTTCERLYKPVNGGTMCIQTCIEEENSPTAGACKKGKCDVLGTFYCSECSQATDSLVNGVCVSGKSSVCTAHTPANGTCKSCAQGYIKYKGGCYQSSADATADICDAQDIVAVGAESMCVKCKQKDEVPLNGECKAKTDDCAASENGTCKVCKTGMKSFQIKGNGVSTTVACFTTCPEGTYESNSICTPCDEHCKTCTEAKKCTDCLAGYYLSSEQCVVCTASNCKTCSSASACTVCQDGYYLDQSTCKKCNTGCGVCTSSNCQTCLDRYELVGNACIERCSIGSSATSCAKDHCVVNGTFACDRCALSSSVIIDGVCKNKDDACIPTTPASGTCSACKNTHILYYGSCYKKDTAPGNTICETSHQIDMGPYTVCTQCKKNGEVPIDGSCVSVTDIRAIASGCQQDTTNSLNSCVQCGPGFFLHAGGCYGLGRQPGTVLCRETGRQSVSGVCSMCAIGYYNPGLLDVKKESCLACNNTTETDGYKGVANCFECNLPANAKVAVCTRCDKTYTPANSGSQCTKSCDDSASSTGKCKTGKCSAFDSLFCEECALATEWPIEGVCTSVDTNQVCEKGSGVCIGCLQGYVLYRGGCYNPKSVIGMQICLKFITIAGRPYCRSCPIIGEASINGVCTSEIPTGATCLEGRCVSCPANYFLFENGCYQTTSFPGSTVCLSTGTDQEAGTCRVCAPGYRRNQATLVCDACTVPNCASCEIGIERCTRCTLPYILAGVGVGAYCAIPCIEGSRPGECKRGMCTAMDNTLCSECADANYVPVNGVCTQYTTITYSRSTPCIKDPKRGACTGCQGDFFFYQGGCYEATKSPGTRICEESAVIVVADQAVCGRCLVDGEVPVDGSCMQQKEGFICNKGVCTECANGMFLFNGGCYKKGQKPGSDICSDTDGNTKTCTACKAGFSQRSGACIKCSDPNCGACAADPNACTACAAGYYLQGTSCYRCNPACTTCNAAGADKCTACAQGYFSTFQNAGPGRCLLCSDTVGKDTWKGVVGCKLCTAPSVAGPAMCTACLPGFKQLPGTPMSCLARCPTKYYEAAGKCVACSVTNCAACTSAKCTSCVEGHTWNGEKCLPNKCPAQCICASGGTTCQGCSITAVEVRPTHSDGTRCLSCDDTQGNGFWSGVDGCKTCVLASQVGQVVCQECQANRKKLVTDGKLQCLASCPAEGFWDSSNTCIPCASGCHQCTSATTCSSCNPDYYPTQTAVSSPSHCRPCNDTLTKNGYTGIANCVTCTVDSTNKSVKCDACATGFGLFGNVCVQCTLPHCTRCDGGVCTACANGMYLSKGRCLICPAPCATCFSGASCLTCADGYFQATPNGSPADCVPCNQTTPTGLHQVGVYGCRICHAPLELGTKLAPAAAVCLICADDSLPWENYCAVAQPLRRISRGAIAGISLGIVALVGSTMGIALGLTVCRRKTSERVGLMPLHA